MYESMHPRLIMYIYITTSIKSIRNIYRINDIALNKLDYLFNYDFLIRFLFRFCVIRFTF